MEIKIPYGTGHLRADIPATATVQLVDPPVRRLEDSEELLVQQALDRPTASTRLEEAVKPGDKVVVIVNDHTRPGPNALMVKHVVQRLEQAGIPDGDILFVIATGSHRATTPHELDTILGEEYHRRIRVHVHDCRDKSNLVCLGESGEGMPIWLNRHVAEADFIVTTGVITPHHSAGFSGGRKSIVPGVAGLETLKIHHSLPIRPFYPAMGNVEANRFHHVALEVAKLVKVGFILNAVQDPHKQNIAFVAGDLEQAHKQGVDLCRAANTTSFEQLADVVIASPGGHPRDRDLYQAQKALSVAETLVRPGGVMILCAKAGDGIGEGLFRQWLTEADTPEQVVERFKREGYDVGSNKAFMYARALTRGKVVIVSESVDAEDLAGMMLDWAPGLQTAVDQYIKPGQRVVVLPRAVNLIPEITG